MRSLVLAGVLIVGPVALATEPDPAQYIEVSADVPVVTIAPRRAGRFAVRLPSLTYSLVVTTYCDANWAPTSVSISIADSRKAFGPEQLNAEQDLELELRVPSSQIAPLRVEEFCMGDAGEDGDTLTIPAALSAQASLRCAMESEQSISYVTKPLDVTLECSKPSAAD